MYGKRNQTKVHLRRWLNSRISNVGLSLTEGLKQDNLTPYFFSFVSCHEIDPESQTLTGRNISLRATFEDLLALKHAIQMVCKGHAEQARRFSIKSSLYSSDEGDQKSLTVEENVLKGEERDADAERCIVLVFSDGANFAIEHYLDLTRAMALADILDFTTDAGLKMDLDTEPIIWADGSGHGVRRPNYRSSALHPPQRKSVRDFNLDHVFG